MSRAEILQVVAALMGACASVVAAAEARLVKRFEKAGATSRGTARELPALGTVGRWRFARLKQTGAVVEASPGHFYLDREAYRQNRNTRRIRAIVLVVLLVATAALIAAILR